MIYLYKHTLKNSRMCYIGQTNNIERRWENNGENYRTSKKFYAAIKKYGWDNFTHEILEETENPNYANKREQYYIGKFNSIAKGFNYDIGGGVNRPNASEFTKRCTLKGDEKKETKNRIKKKVASPNRIEKVDLFEARYIKTIGRKCDGCYKVLTLYYNHNLNDYKNYKGVLLVKYHSDNTLPDFSQFKAKKILLNLRNKS